MYIVQSYTCSVFFYLSSKPLKGRKGCRSIDPLYSLVIANRNMSPSPKKHDVFISFRGKDTRKGFTSHVHHAFRKGNIDTFIDYRLKRGDEVAPALTQAIRDSRISLVIFSKNFAESKWCLNELVEILECREHRAQVVIPVFYNIDPWQVRYQEGSFATAFEEYKREQFWNNDESYEDKVSRWKDALTQAANISGWVSRNR